MEARSAAGVPGIGNTPAPLVGDRFDTRVEGGRPMDCFPTDPGLLGRVVAALGK
jgi:hypothetical protein